LCERDALIGGIPGKHKPASRNMLERLVILPNDQESSRLAARRQSLYDPGNPTPKQGNR